MIRSAAPDLPDGPHDPGLTRLRKEFGAAFLASYRPASGPMVDVEIAAWRPVMLAARLGEGITHERQRLLDLLRLAPPSGDH